MNAGNITNFYAGMPFTNVMRQAKRFVTKNISDLGNLGKSFETDLLDQLPLDQDGYPTQLPYTPVGASEPQIIETAMLNGFGGGYRAGTYRFCLDGSATFRISGAMPTIESVTISNECRDLDLSSESGSGITLEMTSTDASDHARNFRIFHLDFANTIGDDVDYEINPDYIAYLNGLNVGTVRMINWMNVINSPADALDDLNTVTYHTQSSNGRGSGISWQMIATFVDETGINPWLGIPHIAGWSSDDFIREMAQFFRDNIASERHIFVEISNEVWNSSFVENQYARDNSPTGKAEDWVGIVVERIVRIFQEVFIDHSRFTVLAPTYSADGIPNGNQGQYTATVLSYLNEKQLANIAVAVNSYFASSMGDPCEPTSLSDNVGCSPADNATWAPEFDALLSASPETIVDVARKFIDHNTNIDFPSASLDADLQQLLDWVGGKTDLRSLLTNVKSTVDSFGVPMVAYEGGQHLVGRNSGISVDALTGQFGAANRGEQMAVAYEELFTMWDDIGGGMFCAFVDIGPYNSFGSWGLQESLVEPETPKYRAVREYSEQL
jgi:hypothetical protein